MIIKIIADLSILLCGYFCLTVNTRLKLKNFETQTARAAEAIVFRPLMRTLQELLDCREILTEIEHF